MMREVGGGKEDVGRMRFKVKDDAIKSGTSHQWRREMKRWVRERKTHPKQAYEPGTEQPEL